ncbi:hypothetical protein TUM20985_00380 [Mycobacterium antarcticum]|nr:hypothetical protein TUM20985_00380 [Mycolicibacterium sp. TUM20985]
MTAFAAGCAGTPAGPTATPTASVSASRAAPSPGPGTGPRTIADPYAPTIDPSAFSTTVDNPYFPLVPGTRTISEAATPEGRQRTTVEVTRDTKKIMGVDTVVVHDFVTLDGKPYEDTFDWYAQDRDGNVWYFGEATKEFRDDGTVDTKGSFEAGVDGAQPGIIMAGRPQVGDQYRQEYAKGIAEDTGEVLSLTGSETTPLTGATKDMIVTKDLNLLDPTGPIENKYYARGVGLVLTLHVTGPAERDQAIAMEKF